MIEATNAKGLDLIEDSKTHVRFLIDYGNGKDKAIKIRKSALPAIFRAIKNREKRSYNRISFAFYPGYRPLQNKASIFVPGKDADVVIVTRRALSKLIQRHLPISVQQQSAEV